MDHHHEDDIAEHMGTMSEREKLGKLLEYWIRHNEEHAKTYLEWSKKAATEDLKDVASLLEEASDTTIYINRLLKDALKKL
jgi:hypothetical protein